MQQLKKCKSSYIQRLASIGARQALESLLNPIIFPEKRDCAPTKNL
ncbi:hypothetical protein LEP1GSC100_4919 [Leptospira interrogans serovar Bataviae str. UI 08561]|nr:hypothetical protein LEP1GSC100_4919 [Leptospira interrogans serovar Bataviae str. UI 08561]